MAGGLAGIGGALSGVGAIAGAMGKDKQAAQPVSGYATLPKPVRDAYERVYLPGVLDYFDNPFYNIPMKRYENTDPIFGSQALRDVQQWSDAVGGLFSPYKTGDEDPENQYSPEQQAMWAAMMDEMFGRQMVSQQAGPGGMYMTKANIPWQQFQQGASAADFAELGKLLEGAQAAGPGMYAGGFVHPERGLVDTGRILAGAR